LPSISFGSATICPVVGLLQYRKMKRPRRHINLLALLLIPVYLLVLASWVKNRHTHVLPNGTIITHSHPFTDAKTGFPVKHGHTQNQILFLQLFSFDFFESSPEVFIAEDFSNFRSETNTVYTAQISISFRTTAFLRGPPEV